MAQNKRSLSVFIIAFNEADRIGRALGSVKTIADEIIVVDNGSTDNTKSIAESFGAKVIFNEWTGYASQKAFAAEQCTNDWCLNIDADEFLTPELQEEISTLLNAEEEPTSNGYNMEVVTLFPGESKPCRFPHSYNIPRLYRKSKGHIKAVAHSIDDRIYMNDKSEKFGQLEHAMWHRSIRDLSSFIAKQNTYTDNQVRYNLDKGRNFSTLRLMTEFPVSFIKFLFVKGHILRGWYGLTISLTGAYMRFLRIAKTKEAFRIQQNNK